MMTGCGGRLASEWLSAGPGSSYSPGASTAPQRNAGLMGDCRKSGEDGTPVSWPTAIESLRDHQVVPDNRTGGFHDD